MTSDLPAPEPEDTPTHGDRRSRPNYTARRVAVGSVALAVLAVGAVVVLMVTAGSGDDDTAVTSPGWNSLVEVDRVSGDLVVLDRDGEEVTSAEGAGRVTEVLGRADRLALIGSDQVALVGLDGDDPLVVPVDPASSVIRHPSNRSFTIVVSPDVGGEIVIIDGTDGTATELGARAGQSSPLLLPETLRVDRTGTRFAVGDGRNFQTIVVDADPEIEVGFFPGIPMAVSHQLVVTSTNVGRTAELGFFDPDGDRLGLVTTERPIAGVLDGNRFVYVTEQARLLGVSIDDSSPTEIAELDIGPVDDVRPALDGSRLLVSTGSQVIVVDLEGNIVFEADGPLPMTPWDTWRCLAVGDGEPVIIDLESGDVVAELEPMPIVNVSTDGCGVHQRDTDGHTIASATGTYTPRGTVRAVVLSPDGASAVVVATDGSAELVDLEDSRRLDLGTRRGHLIFADR
ncbi:MAG: hypothetical protein EA389_03460 [Ilumatobacter sp.]|nr:MAG: hypothetical protein EA389_03460 [Ilumatobacter sp.]